MQAIWPGFLAVGRSVHHGQINIGPAIKIKINHAYAARSGQYGPLAVWRAGADGFLEGVAELPLAVGIVGGAARAHPGVRLALKMSQVTGGRDLAGLAAAVGLASNLAALKALATDGIQRGHMALHARTVAIEAGAEGDLVLQVAAELQREKCFRVERARELLAALTGDDATR